MIVKLGKHGELFLSQLFTNKEAKKVCRYTVHRYKGVIRIQFYDSKYNIISPKLRKRKETKT